MLLHVCEPPVEFLLEVKCSEIAGNVVSTILEAYEIVLRIQLACAILRRESSSVTLAMVTLAEEHLNANNVGKGKPIQVQESKKMLASLLAVAADDSKIQTELENQVTAANLKDMTNIWLAKRAFDNEKPLSDRVGSNEKSKIKVSLSKTPNIKKTETETGVSVLSQFLKSKRALEERDQPKEPTEKKVKQSDDPDELVVKPELLEKLRGNHEIKQLLREPKLQSKLTKIANTSSSIILQETLDKDPELRKFVDTCLITVGAASEEVDDKGNVNVVFHGEDVLTKASDT